MKIITIFSASCLFCLSSLLAEEKYVTLEWGSFVTIPDDKVAILLKDKVSGNSGTIPDQIPLNTVVIPTDASGPVNIILESSVDLVNWTLASPGAYATSTSNRFFRVRAETAAE